MARRQRPGEARPSDVWNVRITLRAVARCMGVDGDPTPCKWTPRYPLDDRDVRRQAREHIREKLDHEVVVDVLDTTKYYVQAGTIDALRASLAPEGPETPPAPSEEPEES